MMFQKTIDSMDTEDRRKRISISGAMSKTDNAGLCLTEGYQYVRNTNEPEEPIVEDDFGFGLRAENMTSGTFLQLLSDFGVNEEGEVITLVGGS